MDALGARTVPWFALVLEQLMHRKDLRASEGKSHDCLKVEHFMLAKTGKKTRKPLFIWTS